MKSGEQIHINLAKVEVEGSNPFARSNFINITQLFKGWAGQSVRPNSFAGKHRGSIQMKVAADQVPPTSILAGTKIASRTSIDRRGWPS